MLFLSGDCMATKKPAKSAAKSAPKKPAPKSKAKK